MKEKNKAIIFGVSGQIGSYLADLLLSKNYSVYGVMRRVSNPNTDRIKHNLENPDFKIFSGDLTDIPSLFNILSEVVYCGGHGFESPIEIYNLAAQSHVAVSFQQPGLTWDITAKGHLNLLEVIRCSNYQNISKLFFMGSSEMFGSNIDADGFQRETTPLRPNSPYACAKEAAFNMTRIYRDAYGFDARSGIIFNSESPRRGENFVTRKITKWFADYYTGQAKAKLKLGNINSQRDWTHAKDTCEAIYLMMQAKPKDYVVASGQTHSIFDFIQRCHILTEKLDNCCEGLRIKTEDLYEFDSALLRPNEVPYLKGDASFIKKELGWSPKISFDELVEDMLYSDIFI